MNRIAGAMRDSPNNPVVGPLGKGLRWSRVQVGVGKRLCVALVAGEKLSTGCD